MMGRSPMVFSYRSRGYRGCPLRPLLGQRFLSPTVVRALLQGGYVIKAQLQAIYVMGALVQAASVL